MATIDLTESYLTTGLAPINSTVDLLETFMTVEAAAGGVANVDLMETFMEILGPGNPPPDFTTVDLMETFMEILPGGVPVAYTGFWTKNASGQQKAVTLQTQG